MKWLTKQFLSLDLEIEILNMFLRDYTVLSDMRIALSIDSIDLFDVRLQTSLGETSHMPT